MANITVWADYDYDGKLSGGEATAISGADGRYTLNPALRSFALRAVAPAGGSVTSPANGQPYFYQVSGTQLVGYGSTFGVKPGSTTPPTTTTGKLLIHRAVTGQDVLAPTASGPNPDEVFSAFFSGDYSFWIDADRDNVRDADEALLQSTLNTEISYDVPTLAVTLPFGTYAIAASSSSSVRAKAIASNTVTVNESIAQTSFALPAPNGIVWGHHFFDVNADGVQQTGDGAYRMIAAGSVFADYDNDGTRDADEPLATQYFTPQPDGSQLNGLYVLRPQPGRSFTLGATAVDAFSHTLFRTTLAGAPITVAADAAPLLRDIGFAPSQVSGTVYVDTNQNGLRDQNEPAAGAGHTVFVDLNSNGTYDAQTETQTVADANGRYTLAFFGNVVATVYVVPKDSTYTASYSYGYPVTVYGQPSGGPIRRSGLLSGIAPNRHPLIDVNVSLDARASDTGSTFAFPGQTVWADYDYDGKVSPGEPVAITDYRGRGIVYFDESRAFALRVLPPQGYSASTPGGGTYFYDPNGSSIGFAGYFVLTPNPGTTPPSTTSVGGSLYFDSNGNGARDEGEPGQAGTVYIDLNTDGRRDPDEPIQDTSPSGAFRFDGLAIGRDYRIRALAGGLTDTFGGSVNVMTGIAPITTLELGFAALQRGTVQVIPFSDRNLNGQYDRGEGRASVYAIWVDLDRDGKQTFNEPSNYVAVGTVGEPPYDFIDTYGLSLAPGAYRIAIQFYTNDIDYIADTFAEIVVRAGQTTDVALGQAPTEPRISGYLFQDANNNGVRDAGDTPYTQGTVWFDYDDDSVIDDNEPQAPAIGSDGFYAIDPYYFRSGTVRYRPPTGVTQTSPAGGAGYAITIDRFAAYENRNFGVTTGVVTPPPPPPTNTRAISGSIFNDANGNGRQDAGEASVNAATVWADTNYNGILDTGEASVHTDANGSYVLNAPIANFALRARADTGYSVTAPATNVWFYEARAGVLVGYGSTFGVKHS